MPVRQFPGLTPCAQQHKHFEIQSSSRSFRGPMAFGWLFRKRKQVGSDDKVVDKGLCHTVTGSNSQKVPEDTTKLVVQVIDKSLPYSLVKEICDRKHITELDLSQCPNLEVLPAAFAACGLGRRLKVLKLPMRLESENYKGFSPKKKLAAILLRQRRRQAILKLATQPEPMLTTLERLSWLLIILATMTLTVFLQPGMKAVASGDPAETNLSGCLRDVGKDFHPIEGAVALNASLQFWELSEEQRAAIICRCASDSSLFWRLQEGDCSDNFNITWTNLTLVVKAPCEQLHGGTMNCVDKASKSYSVSAFALFTILSFCCTLLCLVLIVVVSLPRLRSTDLAYEAGRLWLFLLFVWLLFVEAVQLAFVSFWLYAWLVYDPSVFGLIYAGLNGGYSYILNTYDTVSIGGVANYYDIFFPSYYNSSWFTRANIPGTSLIILSTAVLTLPALILVCVYFAWIYPGHRAVHLACCACTCIGYTQDFVDSYADRKVHEGDVAIYVSPAPPGIIKVE